TALASDPTASPEPWVAVATDPATEMCGSDARFASARPAAWTERVASPYRSPAATDATPVAGSTSTGGRPSSYRSSTTCVPVVSATSPNECRDPSALTRRERRTTSASSSGVVGCSTAAEEYVRLPAQLAGREVSGVVVTPPPCHSPRRRTRHGSGAGARVLPAAGPPPAQDGDRGVLPTLGRGRPGLWRNGRSGGIET